MIMINFALLIWRVYIRDNVFPEQWAGKRSHKWERENIIKRAYRRKEMRRWQEKRRYTVPSQRIIPLKLFLFLSFYCLVLSLLYSRSSVLFFFLSFYSHGFLFTGMLQILHFVYRLDIYIYIYIYIYRFE